MGRHLARCTTFPSTDEDAVQALDAVRLEHLPVHIDQAIELALAAILGLVGVVEGVDEGERHGAGDAATEDVLAELLGVARVLGGAERGLDRVLEREVQGLRGEVPGKKIYDH